MMSFSVMNPIIYNNITKIQKLEHKCNILDNKFNQYNTLSNKYISKIDTKMNELNTQIMELNTRIINGLVINVLVYIQKNVIYVFLL